MSPLPFLYGLFFIECSVYLVGHKQCPATCLAVSTAYFIRQRDLDDTFNISELLLGDKEDLIHKATGWMLRFAGDKDRARLISFLDEHAATMPRTALRYAIEKFDEKQRKHYLSIKKVG